MVSGGRYVFSQVRTVNPDEYVGLGAGNEQSYVAYVPKNLFDHININPQNTHLTTVWS